MDQDQRKFEILKLTADTRKFEIGLFWSRSLFFWGFTTVAGAAYGAAYAAAAETGGGNRNIQFIVACGGFICSFIWTLVNRSSKYWQRVWEKKAAEASINAFGSNIFAEPPRKHLRLWDFPWWSAHFSVSKLATAFSDFTGLVWVALALRSSRAASLFPPDIVVPLAAALTVGYIFYVYCFCRPDSQRISN